jgi:hypothetical protein
MGFVIARESRFGDKMFLEIVEDDPNWREIFAFYL